MPLLTGWAFLKLVIETTHYLKHKSCMSLANGGVRLSLEHYSTNLKPSGIKWELKILNRQWTILKHLNYDWFQSCFSIENHMATIL